MEKKAQCVVFDTSISAFNITIYAPKHRNTWFKMDISIIQIVAIFRYRNWRSAVNFCNKHALSSWLVELSTIYDSTVTDSTVTDFTLR